LSGLSDLFFPQNPALFSASGMQNFFFSPPQKSDMGPFLPSFWCRVSISFLTFKNLYLYRRPPRCVLNLSRCGFRVAKAPPPPLPMFRERCEGMTPMFCSPHKIIFVQLLWVEQVVVFFDRKAYSPFPYGLRSAESDPRLYPVTTFPRFTLLLPAPPCSFSFLAQVPFFFPPFLPPIFDSWEDGVLFSLTQAFPGFFDSACFSPIPPLPK